MVNLKQKKELILQLSSVSKYYQQAKEKLLIIEDASFCINKNEKVALIGPSGCGKTTILQIAGLLDIPNEGEVLIESQKITTNTSDEIKTKIRRNKIGFIYQFHHLLPEFTSLENVMLPLLVQGCLQKDACVKAKNILSDLGLGNKLNSKPSELSGGEQQRVAIARAIVIKPTIVLADEPTGNLDPKTSKEVLNVLMDVIDKNNLTLLMVTHDYELAKKADKILCIKNGVVVKLDAHSNCKK